MFFFRWQFSCFSFFTQRLCSVDFVLIASYASANRNPKSATTAVKSFFFGENFHNFPFFFYKTFPPSRSRFHRKVCKLKTQSKERNDSRKIACFLFFGEDFHDFPFFMQRFWPVNNILIADYTRVKHNQKSAMTAKKSHFHDFPFFMQRFCPVNHFLIATYTRVKHNQKSAMTAGKSHVFWFFGENFHDFPFFMQRFCPVDHVFIASYASVKRNPKSVMTAG